MDESTLEALRFGIAMSTAFVLTTLIIDLFSNPQNPEDKDDDDNQ